VRSLLRQINNLRINGVITNFRLSPSRMREFEAKEGDVLEMAYLGPSRAYGDITAGVGFATHPCVDIIRPNQALF